MTPMLGVTQTARTDEVSARADNIFLVVYCLLDKGMTHF